MPNNSIWLVVLIVAVVSGAIGFLYSGFGPASDSTINVIGVDYAFQGVPDTLPAGKTEFNFVNSGQVPHEMVIAQLKEGVSLEDIFDALEQDADPMAFVAGVIVLIAAPGAMSIGTATVNLIEGRTYALICNFQDAEDSPPHTELGMFASFEVR